MNKVSLIVYPAKELASTKKIFSRFLGVEPYVDGPYYVGYREGNMEIGLDPNAQNAGPIAYIEVADIKRSLQEIIALGQLCNKTSKMLREDYWLQVLKIKTGIF